MGKSLLKIGFGLLLLAGVGAATDVIDRIVAVVNGHIILQSQWDESVAYEALLNQRPAGIFTVEQRKGALDRLIDQELIRQQSRPADFHPASSSDIENRISDIRKNYPEASSDSGWRSLLAKHGLRENDLWEKVAAEIDEMRAVDAHLRPGVQVDSRSVESYYRDKLLPELEARGAKQVALADVSPEIREVLAQQKINDLLIAWLHTLRTASTIKTPFSGSEGEAH
jgi:peptidyl-prolyl cis-trans isomerase SurA